MWRLNYSSDLHLRSSSIWLVSQAFLAGEESLDGPCEHGYPQLALIQSVQAAVGADPNESQLFATHPPVPPWSSLCFSCLSLVARKPCANFRAAEEQVQILTVHGHYQATQAQVLDLCVAVELYSADHLVFLDLSFAVAAATARSLLSEAGPTVLVLLGNQIALVIKRTWMEKGTKVEDLVLSY